MQHAAQLTEATAGCRAERTRYRLQTGKRDARTGEFGTSRVQAVGNLIETHFGPPPGVA
jgi:hypothetical protein